MREIKFRAWNNETKTMLILDPLEWQLCALKEEDNWKVMQYTGLKDKNGKEVYEGDLLKTNDRIVEVVWHKQCGGWDTNLVKYIGKRKSNGLDNAEWQFRAKIIGNIYENSELLGEQ